MFVKKGLKLKLLKLNNSGSNKNIKKIGRNFNFTVQYLYYTIIHVYILGKHCTVQLDEPLL